MGFLLRCAFWLSLVLLIIPIGGASSETGEETVSPITAFFAAREAVGDLIGMCDRKPEVCEVGRSAVHTITVRARESARIAMDMIEDERTPATDMQVQAADHADAPFVTGSVPSTDPVPTPRPERIQP